MDSKELRALQIAAGTRLEPDNGRWMVPSQNGNGRYAVTVDEGGLRCECPAFEETGECKHSLAVAYTLGRENGGRPLDLGELVQVTASRDWATYNLARTREGQDFPELLADLCALVPQPSYTTGRPRLPLADMVFATVLRAYVGVSARVFAAALGEAQSKDHIEVVPSPTSFWRYAGSPAMTPILDELVTVSSLPLKAVESDFAVDSSGFTTRRRFSWYTNKQGRQVKAHEWLKVHLIVGTHTNVITGVEITDWAENDSPFLPGLVDRTAVHFGIRAVSADKGYLSKRNAEAIERVGATPFIPFKVNSVRPDEGTAWARMWHYYSYRREEFLAHYHRRSNVETAFSVIKGRFGEALLCKSDTAQVNELLARLVAYNLCLLARSRYELGIEPSFTDLPGQSAA